MGLLNKFINSGTNSIPLSDFLKFLPHSSSGELVTTAGIYSINEIRKLEELDALPNGDKHYRSLIYVDIDFAEEYQKNKTQK